MLIALICLHTHTRVPIGCTLGALLCECREAARCVWEWKLCCSILAEKQSTCCGVTQQVLGVQLGPGRTSHDSGASFIRCQQSQGLQSGGSKHKRHS